MIRCPSEAYTPRKEYKRNQIGRKFSDIFDLLLDPRYYEGTLYGQNFRRLSPDKTSKIYVKDPLEDTLREFCNSKVSAIRYLVGFTGMGKTTLLRNLFKVPDRDVHFYEDQLIIYISFYYANLNSDIPQQSVESEVIKYLIRAIEELLPSVLTSFQNDDDFWIALYDYMESNKPISIQNSKIVPGISLRETFTFSGKKSVEQKKSLLSLASEENRLEYYASMLKYLLSQANKVHNVYFLFDDIESKEGIFHRPVVEVARHLHSCFSCLGRSDILTKTIVSLRAYTFRSNIDRQLEARREQIEQNTIFKRETVKLNEIFDVRFQELEEVLKTEENAQNKQTYLEAVYQVKKVSRQIDSSFANTILSLANCNLCHAMSMYNSILTNVEWIAKGENETAGAFKVSAESYRLTAKTVFHALACGNENIYIDSHSNYFPNILHNDGEEGAELINLMILRYLKSKKAIDLYGEVYVEKNTIVHEISDLFINVSDTDITAELWRERIITSINYLYRSGILLKSIYDIEYLNNTQIERSVSKQSKLYISPRGQFLYSLFPQNALLLELYRDSIHTNLQDNDRLTSEMRTVEVMNYLISYIEKLFEYEKRFIGSAISNLKKYQEFFGNELFVSPLLEGLAKNIGSYFQKEDSNEYSALATKMRTLLENINQYISVIFNETNIKFCVTNIFERV